MKKLFLVFAISAFFVACNDGATTTEETTTEQTDATETPATDMTTTPGTDSLNTVTGDSTLNADTTVQP